MEPARGRLRDALRSRLLNQMIRSVGTPADKWKVLVADRAALRILAAALQVNQLVNEGITIVEMLDMRREPLPRIPAIYFVTPTAETVEHLVQEESTQYKAFHIFFTSRLPDFLMDALRKNTSLLRKVKAFVELDVEVLALESRLFSLDRPAASLPQLHSEGATAAREEMAIISRRLTEACNLVAPGIEWCVRHDATSSTSRTVSSLVKEQLETTRLEHRNKEKPPEEQDAKPHDEGEGDDYGKPTKATLLIVDRATDTVTPLVHEFSYQALAHDLLELDYRKPGGAHIEIGEDEGDKKKKSVQLDDEDKDPVWTSIRATFIEEALAKAQAAFKEFLETDAAFKIRGKGAAEIDIKDMGAAVRALPDSQMLADKHAMHIKAIKQCLAICANQNLTGLALVEQDLVIGRHPDSTRVRAEPMVESITEVLSDATVPVAHRVRLVMIALAMCEGVRGLGGETSVLVKSATFRPRLRRSGFDEIVEMQSELASAIKGVEKLIKVAKTGAEKFDPKAHHTVEGDETVASKLKYKYEHRKALKHNEKVNAVRLRRHGLEEQGALRYDVARYHPPLRSVMMDIVDDELDTDNFPITGSVSVDSIIASMGQSSLDDYGDTQHKKFGASSIKSQSAAVAGLVKSIARGDSHKSMNSDEDDGRFRLAESGHIYVVFVVGGVCYSEVRAMYEVCAKREANILIGGSQILTPKIFMNALAAVTDPVIRIRAMLPPLPLELAQSRAARARAQEAGAERKPRGKDPSPRGGPQSQNHGSTNETNTADIEAERQEADVEVVTGYKKNKGLRLFGRKKK